LGEEMLTKTREADMSCTLPISEHFTLEELAEGVYAAIAIEGKAAFSNAGIVDLGDRTIVFDAFEAPIAAQDLREAAESLTGRPVTTLVISHAHDDHWLGDQAFSGATIVSTSAVREQMVASVAEIEEDKADPGEIESIIREQQERLAGETDERRRADIEHTIARWQYALQALPTLDPILPHQTFDGRIVFHGVRRRVELITQGKGHTSSDCYLILPEAKIAFVGDLAFFGRQPFVVYCDPQAWVAQLEGFERSGIDVFVPGHGPVGTKTDVALVREYILMLEDWVTQALEKDEPVEEVLKRPLPALFDDWSVDGVPAEHNVRALYERMSTQEEQAR
jgi:glyoxylase-like metal-dependent hydrolase (beta-lactamase superfamily II)